MKRVLLQAMVLTASLSALPAMLSWAATPEEEKSGKAAVSGGVASPSSPAVATGAPAIPAAPVVEKTEATGPAMPAAEPSKTPPGQAAAGPAGSPAGAADGPKPAPQGEDVVVLARVGDRQITAADLMNYVSRDTRLVTKATTVPGRTAVLREMIVDRLLEEGMRREGFLPTARKPEKQDYFRAYSLLANRYFPEPKESPPEEQVQRYYTTHPEHYGIPASARIGQIQFRVPPTATPEQRAAVKARAEEALKRLRAGESFGDLAAALTENPRAKAAKGDLGFLQFQKDPWLQQAISGLTVGQFTGVIESPAGYEILLLQEKRDAVVLPYAEVRDAVVARMRLEAQQQAREAYVRKLAGEVKVTVEAPELRGAMP